jgi:5-formyltetrahydrofolate cyclo-ligase
MESAGKASLRIRARVAIGSLSPEARATAAAEIRQRIEGLPEWPEAETVALYAAQAGEPDLHPLLCAPGKVFCFPRMAGEGLEFHRCEPHELQPGRWKLMEPDAASPVVAPTGIDLMLIPGLAFTRAGARLGRGGGYYDRYLAKVSTDVIKVGVCFNVQLVEELISEIHDREVDMVVTESELIRCRA